MFLRFGVRKWTTNIDLILKDILPNEANWLDVFKLFWTNKNLNAIIHKNFLPIDLSIYIVIAKEDVKPHFIKQL